MPRAPKSSTPKPPKCAAAVKAKDVSRLSLVDAARICPHESHYRKEYEKKGEYEAYLRRQANNKCGRVMVRMLGGGPPPSDLSQAMRSIDKVFKGQASPALAWAVSETWRMQETQRAASRRHYAAAKLVPGPGCH